MSSSKHPIRMGKQLAMKFEPGRGYALEVLNFPSKTEAKRYVRVNKLTVLRGEFKFAPQAVVVNAACPREQA